MKKIMNNKKGIDTILAALLMVVIVVVASVMVYAWSTGLLGALMGNGTGNVGKEALSMEFSGFNCPATGNCYNATLNIRNVGTAAASLASYYVTDPNGNQYARTAWATDNGPNQPNYSGSTCTGFGPNALCIAYINIGTASGSTSPAKQCNVGGTYCTYSGSAPQFTFNSGTQYTIKIITTRNSQFTFTVVR